MMMHFCKSGNWQYGVGVDFLGEFRYKEQLKNPLLMEEDVDGLSDRQIEIVSGRTGWTGNKFIFVGGYWYGDRNWGVKKHIASSKDCGNGK